MGRSKLAWKPAIRADIAGYWINGTVAEDRRAWKVAIRPSDPAVGGIMV